MNALSVQNDLPFQGDRAPGNWWEMSQGILGTSFRPDVQDANALLATQGFRSLSVPVSTPDGDLR
ncbi:MAG: hypothetical protein ACP5NU_04220 [Methanomicrobiales archaeon]